MITEGDLFPDFSLSDQDGNVVTRDSLRGAKAVIYFYPKDDTPGCTTESCEFRDALPKYGTTRILGVSPDGVKSHRKFADKFSLPFPLLADEEHQLADALGVWVEKSMYGKTYMGVDRSTFVLDEEGKVIRAFRKVKPAGHADEVLAALG